MNVRIQLSMSPYFQISTAPTMNYLKKSNPHIEINSSNPRLAIFNLIYALRRVKKQRPTPNYGTPHLCRCGILNSLILPFEITNYAHGSFTQHVWAPTDALNDVGQ